MTPLPQLSDTEFRRVQRIVYQTAGIAIAETSRTLLSSRVRKRLRALQLDSFRDYLGRLNGDPSGKELEALMDAVSTNETSFFRTPAHFDWFSRVFLPEQIELASRAQGFKDRAPQDQAPKDLKIWSAACSTGQEAYSLAIILCQQQSRLSRLNVQLFGSDISTSAIERAQQALFSKASVAKLDASTRRFFTPTATEELCLRESVRSKVCFAIHNLMQPAPYRDLDCMFLRNVLIYFDQASKGKVLENAVASLRPGGYLVLGPSEGVFDIPAGMQRVQSFLFQRL